MMNFWVLSDVFVFTKISHVRFCGYQEILFSCPKGHPFPKVIPKCFCKLDDVCSRTFFRFLPKNNTCFELFCFQSKSFFKNQGPIHFYSMVSFVEWCFELFCFQSKSFFKNQGPIHFYSMVSFVEW